MILEAHQHQMIPFKMLVKELQPERKVGQNPIFQVMLSMDPSLPSLPEEWMLVPMEVESGQPSLTCHWG